MNKDVFNYLSEKAHDVTDYIRAKAEAVGTYLEDHATDIKDGIVKGTATVLTTAMLLGGMTGCDVAEQIGQPKLEQFEQLPIRPIDEIEQTGIKAEDVLALYDDLAEKCIEAHYATTNWKDKLGDRFDELDGQFVSISPTSSVEIGFGDNYILPFYLQTNFFKPSNRWSTENSSPFFTNKSFVNEDIYETILTINTNFGDSSGKGTFQWGVPKQAYDNVLRAFNTPSVLLNKDQLEGTIPNEFFLTIGQNELWGTEAFKSIPLTREAITNANSEQLWALYNLIDCMIELNFNSNLPQTDFELEESN